MRKSGFTLVELLVTIALIAIMAGVALPNFRGLIDSNRDASVYNEVLAGLRHARSEAIRCRAYVEFSLSNDDGWRYSVDYPTGVVGTCELRALDRGLEEGPDSVTQIVFDKLGKSDCEAGSGCSITVGGRALHVYSTGYIGNLDNTSS